MVSFPVHVLRATCAAASLAAVSAQALPTYTIQDIGPFDGLLTTISNNGHVAGTYNVVSNTVTHAFLYTPGSGFQDLGSLGEGLSSTIGAQAVNDAGHVAGANAAFANGTWQAQAFLYSKQTGMQSLGTLGGAPTFGMAINNLGHVAGYSFAPSGDRRMLLHDGSTMSDLGSIGSIGGDVRAMNDVGQITGSIGGTTLDFKSRGFVYTPGTGFTELGTLGGLYSLGNDINETGSVAGQASTAEWIGEKGGFYRTHAVLYAPDGTPTDLGALGVNEDSFATGLNDAGLAVGMSGQTPFLYADGAMVDLRALLDPQGAEGWTFITADDINNDGLISGHGLFNGQHRAFLATPMEPGGGQCRVPQSVIGAAVAALRKSLGG